MIRTVTADAGPVFPNGATGAGEGSDTVVFNIGSTTVYVDSDYTVTPGTGIPVRAGSNVTWGAGVPLYACTDPGNTGTLGFNDGAGAMFDAGGVANQLIAQGLAGDIAAQIALSGAPPIDVNAVIFTDTYTTAANTDHLTAPIDVSKYQSITVRVSEVAPAGGAVERNVELQWMDSSGSNMRDSDGFGSIGTNGASDSAYFTTYQTSVRGPDLIVKVRGNSASGTTFNIQITGSYKAVSSPRYVCRSAYWVGAAGQTLTGKGFDGFAALSLTNCPGNTQTSFTPPVKNGQATFSWDAVAPAGAGLSIQLAVVDLESNVVLYNSGSVAVASGGTITLQGATIVIPNRPLYFYVNTGGGAAAWPSVRCALSYLDH